MIKQFTNKPNFQVTSKEDGKKYWISRSVAVVPIIFFIYENKTLVPLGKRSESMELCPGKWGLASGFLDFDENAGQAVQREVWEELGLDISDPDSMDGSIAYPFSVYSEPNNAENQTVSLRFVARYWAFKELPELKPNCTEVVDTKYLDVTEWARAIAKDDFDPEYPEKDPDLAFNHFDLVLTGLHHLNNIAKSEST